MLTLHIAYTEPVNSDDSIPPLTHEQVWNGLKCKVRRPQDFIPSLTDCKVIEERDDGNFVVREALVAPELKASPMAGISAREECRLYPPTRTYFTLPNESVVQNILSVVPDNMLYLTFTYDWKFENMEPGTEEARNIEESHMDIAKSSVKGTIRAVRAMVGKGKL
ncbi:hypothetical protein EYZ11_006201 [Aspergillus tanneri]|uniref:DUF1857 domain-containing protein n=1 Tax=Aspergillus tanneri TaxID=1220188 RepID=A0A4S3JGM7_9EURO|nr:hypothetical protein EYZ11_006201 [Aspergillus tanneri]